MHVMKECNYSGIDEGIEDSINEEGQRIEWMKKAKQKREEKGQRGKRSKKV